MEIVARKRHLHEPKGGSRHWKDATVRQRLEAVETINRLGEREYAEQAFPRVYRVTRKSRG